MQQLAAVKRLPLFLSPKGYKHSHLNLQPVERLILLEPLIRAPLRFIRVCFPPDCRVPPWTPGRTQVTFIRDFNYFMWRLLRLLVFHGSVDGVCLPSAAAAWLQPLEILIFAVMFPFSPADYKAQAVCLVLCVFALYEALQFAHKLSGSKLERCLLTFWELTQNTRITATKASSATTASFNTKPEEEHNLATQCNAAANIFPPPFS